MRLYRFHRCSACCGVILGLVLLWMVVPFSRVLAQTSRSEEFSAQLQFAEDAWVFGDYDLVVETLQPWLIPTPPAAEQSVLIRAWTRLGSAAWYEGDTALAATCFLEVLRLDPGHELDRLLYPAQVIQEFERVRTEFGEELGVQVEAPQAGETIYLLRSASVQSPLVSAVPFGYGFFARGDDTVGTLYLLSTASLGVSSAWLFIANEVARSEDGLFDDAARARERQRAQVGTGIAFFVVIAANVAHGLLTHQRESDVRYQSLDRDPQQQDPQAPRLRWQPGRGLVW